MLNKNINKILVIKHGSLGDIVFALEAMFSIRNHFKKSNIFILTENKFQKFFEKSNYFDGIILDNRSGVLNSLKVLNILIKNKFNLVIDLQNSKRSNLYNFCLKHLSNSLINSHRSNANFKYVIKPKGTETPKIGLNNQINLIGVKLIVDDYKWLNIDTGITDFKNLVLIIPSTSNSGKYKQWPEINFINLCKRLEKDGKKICVVGSKNDKKITKNIVNNCKSALDFTEKSPPEIIFSIAKNCQLVVTNDTGPGHIAALSKNKVLWLAINNLTTKINIENSKSNIKILSDKIENIVVDEVYNKIKAIL
tara:strand:- start:339 stop:1262 length:924 start_codon:yes stop_codon:yes gene_type:complete